MADTDKQILGSFGESIAADHLKKNGYRIIECNKHLGKNELDIIAEDNDCIVFVEVKTRTCLYPEWGGYGVPSRAVDHKKRGNIVKAAHDYLFSYYGGKQPRIDVIEVYVYQRPGGSFSPTVLNVNHIRNAVDARGRRLH